MTHCVDFGAMTPAESILIAAVDTQTGGFDVCLAVHAMASQIVAGYSSDDLLEMSPRLWDAMIQERTRLGRILDRDDVLRLVEAEGAR